MPRGRPGGGPGPGGGRGRGGGGGFGRFPRLVEPALLYLLAQSDTTHGYDLIAQANDLAICDTVVDAGAVYRALRGMEGEGLVASDWDTSRGGPAQRDYSITPQGRAHLQSWAEVLRRRGETMLGFARLCDELDEGE